MSATFAHRIDKLEIELATLRARLAEAEKVIQSIADYPIADGTGAAMEMKKRARAFLAEQGEGKGDVRRWRHRKRGSTYTIVANAQVQTDTPLSDYAEVIVYKSEIDGKVWARPVTEFQERFDEIDEQRKEVMPDAAHSGPELHATPPQPVEPPAGATRELTAEEESVLHEALRTSAQKTPTQQARDDTRAVMAKHSPELQAALRQHLAAQPDYRAIAARLMEALQEYQDVGYESGALYEEAKAAIAAARAAGLGGE